MPLSCGFMANKGGAFKRAGVIIRRNVVAETEQIDINQNTLNKINAPK